MNREETLKILSMITAIYPSYANNRNVDVTANVWQACFADEPYEIVSKALGGFISCDTKGFPPVPGQIKEIIAQMIDETSAAPTEQAAWGLVRRAISNGIYGYRDEYAKLPDDIKMAIGAPEQIREWALMDEDSVNSVVASNFQRSYRARSQRTREWSKMPKSVTSGLQALLADRVETIHIESRETAYLPDMKPHTASISDEQLEINKDGLKAIRESLLGIL